jgi:hypothetical protein
VRENTEEGWKRIRNIDEKGYETGEKDTKRVKKNTKQG